MWAAVPSAGRCRDEPGAALSPQLHAEIPVQLCISCPPRRLGSQACKPANGASSCVARSHAGPALCLELAGMGVGVTSCPPRPGSHTAPIAPAMGQHRRLWEWQGEAWAGSLLQCVGLESRPGPWCAAGRAKRPSPDLLGSECPCGMWQGRDWGPTGNGAGWEKRAPTRPLPCPVSWGTPIHSPGARMPTGSMGLWLLSGGRTSRPSPCPGWVSAGGQRWWGWAALSRCWLGRAAARLLME